MNEPSTILEPIAGYCVDLYHKLRNRIFVPHSLLKLHNIKVARDMGKAANAIEIGSYKGVTTRRLSYLFEQVLSVEIDPLLYNKASDHCRNARNVQIYLGNGKTLLPEMVGKVDNVLLFLDGHFSGGDTGQGDEPEPVLHELDVVSGMLDRINAIVIDDFRLFGVEEGWPSKSAVFGKLENLFHQPDWAIHVLNDQILVVRSQKEAK